MKSVPGVPVRGLDGPARHWSTDVRNRYTATGHNDNGRSHSDMAARNRHTGASHTDIGASQDTHQFA
jgi:hypothetical protein